MRQKPPASSFQKLPGITEPLDLQQRRVPPKSLKVHPILPECRSQSSNHLPPENSREKIRQNARSCRFSNAPPLSSDCTSPISTADKSIKPVLPETRLPTARDSKSSNDKHGTVQVAFFRQSRYPQALKYVSTGGISFRKRSPTTDAPR